MTLAFYTTPAAAAATLELVRAETADRASRGTLYTLALEIEAVLESAEVVTKHTAIYLAADAAEAPGVVNPAVGTVYGDAEIRATLGLGEGAELPWINARNRMALGWLTVTKYSEVVMTGDASAPVNARASVLVGREVRGDVLVLPAGHRA